MAWDLLLLLRKDRRSAFAELSARAGVNQGAAIKSAATSPGSCVSWLPGAASTSPLFWRKQRYGRERLLEPDQGTLAITQISSRPCPHTTGVY